MDVLTPVVTGVLLTVFTVILAWLGNGRFGAVDKRFDAIDKRFDSVDKRFDAVDRRFDALEKRLDDRIDSVRSDLTNIALAVGDKTRH